LADYPLDSAFILLGSIVSLLNSCLVEGFSNYVKADKNGGMHGKKN